MSKEKMDREDRALDALVVRAFRDQSVEDEIPDLSKPAPSLNAEDKRALDQLGPDLVDQVLSAAREPAARTTSADVAEDCGWSREREASAKELELAGSMYRGGTEDDLTDAAREEMERKIRELEEQDCEAHP